MIRKKLSKLCVILLLVSVLLPFFDSIHVDEHRIALVDDIPGTTVIPK